MGLNFCNLSPYGLNLYNNLHFSLHLYISPSTALTTAIIVCHTKLVVLFPMHFLPPKFRCLSVCACFIFRRGFVRSLVQPLLSSKQQTFEFFELVTKFSLQKYVCCVDKSLCLSVASYFSISYY